MGEEDMYGKPTKGKTLKQILESFDIEEETDTEKIAEKQKFFAEAVEKAE